MSKVTSGQIMADNTPKAAPVLQRGLLVAELNTKVSELAFQGADASRFVGDLFKCPRLSCGSGLSAQAGVSWLEDVGAASGDTRWSPKVLAPRLCLFQGALRPKYGRENVTLSQRFDGLASPTGDAEGRGADADLPERHVPQQARVQGQDRSGRGERHRDPLHVCGQRRRQTRVRGERAIRSVLSR